MKTGNWLVWLAGVMVLTATHGLAAEVGGKPEKADVTVTYAQASGAMLDAWLTSSAPFRKAIESTMTQVLTQLNMPTRSDVTNLAERLTHIEMRLDDLEAKLDERQPAPPEVPVI